MIKYSFSDIKKVSGQDSLVGRLYYRRIATYFSFFFVRTNITPNQISGLSLTFGLISAVLFAVGSNPYIFIAAFTSQIAVVMDYSDGQVARLKGLGSKRGAWFDVVNGAIQNNVIVLGILIGLSKQNLDREIWIFGFLALFAWNMMGFVHLTQMFIFSISKPLRKTSFAVSLETIVKIRPQDFAIGGDVYYLVFGIAALLNQLFIALIIMMIIGNLYWIFLATYIFITSKDIK